jgi:hypothetical protein
MRNVSIDHLHFGYFVLEYYRSQIADRAGSQE